MEEAEPSELLLDDDILLAPPLRHQGIEQGGGVSLLIREVGIQGGHSEDCRRRIEKCMESDAELKVRLDVARERQYRYLAEEFARGDRSGPAQAPEIVEDVLESEDAPGVAESRRR